MANLSGPTGNLFSNIMANVQQITPVVGMGATELCYTDRHACTIVEIITPKKIVVQYDEAKRIDSNGMSDSQTYEFSPNPSGHKMTVTFRKNGRWIKKGESLRGTSFLIGYRKHYHDFSF